MGDRQNNWQDVSGSYNAVVSNGGKATVNAHPRNPPPRIDPAQLEKARANLARMPVHRVPEVLPLPERSVVSLQRYGYFVGRQQTLLELARLLRPANDSESSTSQGPTETTFNDDPAQEAGDETSTGHSSGDGIGDESRQVSDGPGLAAAATGLAGVGKTQVASEFVHRYGTFSREVSSGSTSRMPL